MTIDVPLDLYKIFCMVVKKGNMSAAAKELFISQPAVSMAIKQLEDKLGKPLLIRSSKGISTTAEGGVLYEYLKQGLSLIETAEKKYLEMLNLETGEIKIGAGDTILSKFLMPYIKKFISTYSGINFKITNRTTSETIRLLKNGKVDIGFVNLPIEPDDTLEVHKCLEIHDCLIGGAKYAYLEEDGIDIKNISAYPLMLLEQASNSRRYFDKYALEHGVVLSPIIELGSIDLLEEFAMIGMGLALVTREFSKNELDSRKIVEIPLTPPIPPRYVGLIKLKGVAASYAANTFVSYFVSSL